MTLFKLNPLAAACAAALGLSAGNALALTAFEAPDVEIYLSGASAPQNLLGEIANKFFDAGQGIFVYHDNNATAATFTDDGRSYRAYYGVVKNDPSINPALVGKKVRLINRAKGGSVWGVNPVARAEAIANLKISMADCVLNTSIYRCPEQGSDATQNNTANRVPDFGVSDVEPNMFKGPLNVEFGAVQLSASEATIFGGTQFGASSLMMGMVATDSVPSTLKLSTADYGAMLTANVPVWDLVGDGSVTGPVTVCRRVQGSGTQASYNWYFNNFPCTTDSLAGNGSTAPARMADSAGFDDGNGDGIPDGSLGTSGDPIEINPDVGYTVVENPSSGNVRDCLARAQSGTDHQFTGDDGKVYKVLFSKAGVDKAIGVLSLDSLNSESGWSFRALDGAGRINPATDLFECTSADQHDCGVAPAKANHRDGIYDFAVELSLQYRNATKTNAGNAAGCVGDASCQTVEGLTNPVNALKKAFADDFIKFLGDPAVLDTLAAGPKAATMALPIAFTPDGTNNVAKATRFGNTCSPLQKQF